MQLQDGLRQGEPTFVTVLLEETNIHHLTLHEFVSMVLDEFVGLIPNELPKLLPSRRAINH